jgi:endonuclease/exonuclease/phosphatase family metal-dependent hydrolase
MCKLCLIFFILLAVISTEAQEMKLMSYNIRYDNPGDNPNHWVGRKEKLIALIEKYNPDLLGVQEALHHQLEDMVEAMPHFTYAGVGRDDGKTKGEYSALLYNTHRYELLHEATFWLSEGPEVIASKSWDAAITRIVSWAELKDKQSGKTFFWFNTHFDHIGKEARLQSALLIKKQIEKIAGKNPVLVSGDFNCDPHDAPYQALIAKGKAKLLDAASGFSSECTFYGFNVNQQIENCVRIDYIFRSKHFKVVDFITINDNDGKYYPSDHLPVMATLKF